jgi:transposase
MIQIEFTEEQIEQLRHERFAHPHPRVQKKMEALLLKSEELPHGRIAKLLEISENTLREYFREFLDGGIERLKETRWMGPTSQLSPFCQTIKDYFEAHPPATLQEAQQRIEEITGIRRGRTQVHEFLKSLGFSWRKVGTMPAKADVDVQADFKKTSWSPV